MPERSVAVRWVVRAAVLVAITLMAAAGNVESREDDRPNLAGIYICDGTNADGSRYQAFVEIVEHGGAYVVRWEFGSQAAHMGIGVVAGNVLAVTYGGLTPGVAAYTIDDPTRLVGTWTVVGAGGRVYPETLTKLIGSVDTPSDMESLPRPRPPSRPAMAV